MKQLLLTALALWAIVLGPGLCVAGVLTHLCVDCPQTAGCEHEEDCAADPCLEPVVRVAVGTDSGALATVVVLVASLVVSEIERTEPPVPVIETQRRDRKNLPLPESALPLLN